MTVKKFVQSLLLVLCMVASAVALPIGLVMLGVSLADKPQLTASGPVFVFEQVR